jgi:tetratricopeptide (TPR) repeat protein
MKKILFSLIITISIITPAAGLRITPVIKAFAASTEEQKYDSMQWYFKARYLYEQRKDFDGAKKAILKACELDFDNAEAFAYMYVLADTIKLSIPGDFKLKIPEYEGKSGGARRWYINGVEAFNRRDFQGALFCFEQAVKDDITNEQASYMLNAAKREITLSKFRERIEYRIIGASSVKKDETNDEPGSNPRLTDSGPTADAKADKKDSPELKTAPEPIPDVSDSYKNKYLSIKTAKLLLEAGSKIYDPKKFSEWLGFARYIYGVNKDPQNALLAIDAALLFYESNETALKFKNELAELVKADEIAEKDRLRREAEAIEKARLSRIEQEKNKRSVAVSEVVIADKPLPEAKKEIKITGDFTDEDFLIDTLETDIGEQELTIPSNKPVAMPVNEIILANDIKPSAERKNLIEETKRYVLRHSKLANAKYSQGKLHEALLEYEKIYEKILQIDANDVKSLYNLVLLYKKMGEQRNSQRTFIRLVNAINETSARYSGSKKIQKIYQFVDCTVKASIINASVLAYNQKSYYPMNRSNFDLSKLKEKKYLLIGEDEDREIMLSLVADSFSNQTYRTYKFMINGHNCKAGGKYSIGAGGVVNCSVHGDSVIILSGQQLDKVRYDK